MAFGDRPLDGWYVLETSAQEKALKQKEMEALYGNKAFDFEEPPEPTQTSSDAPGMLLILGGFLIVLLVRRKWYNLIWTSPVF